MANQIQSTESVKSYEIGDLILMPNDEIKENHNLKEKAIVLNNVAAAIWKCIEKGDDLDQIQNYLLNTFEVDYESVKKDLRFFLESLMYLGLISETTLNFEDSPVVTLRIDKDRQTYRHPKMYVYLLDKDQEIAFGPHIRGQSHPVRAVSMVHHGGCC